LPRRVNSSWVGVLLEAGCGEASEVICFSGSLVWYAKLSRYS